MNIQPCTALNLGHLSAEPKLGCMNTSREGADIIMRWSLQLLLLIDGSGERRPEPRHGRVSRGVTPDDCVL